MIYLDYSATTPVDDRVLDTFVKVTKEYIGNPNSLHELGVEAKKLIDASTKQIANILRVKENEIIYTSGASEANNMAIKGICFKYKNRGKHIITTTLEHSSVLEVFKYLENEGFEVSYAKLDENGVVDIDELKKIIRDDTIIFVFKNENVIPMARASILVAIDNGNIVLKSTLSLHGSSSFDKASLIMLVPIVPSKTKAIQ